jgi:hypothetical protein
MRSPLLLALAVMASPALADHLGPSGVGSGSGLDVFSPDTLDEGHGGIGFRLVYTRPERRSDAELEALAVRGIAAHNTDYNLNASLGAAYGITHELTIAVELPYVRRDHLREGDDSGGIPHVEQLGTVAGIGDMSLLAKYRLTGEEGLRFAIVGGLKVPTGSTQKRDLNGGRLETEHQPATGSWDPVFGASAAAKLNTIQLTASALYQLSGEGAQHTRLGDRLQGGLMFSHHFGPVEAEPEHHRHDGNDGAHQHIELRRLDSWDAFVEFGGEWEGRQRIEGDVEQASGGQWAYAAPGMQFNSASGWSVGAAFAIPLWQHIRASHPNNAYRLMLSFGRGF